MGKEAIGYLTSDQQQSIEAFAEEIHPLVEKYPRLKTADLVVEGGVGNGVAIAHIARYLFPDVLYVGTELLERRTSINPRQREKIDEAILSRVQTANQPPTLAMQGATIYGNCFDTELIRDIVKKTGRKVPLLVSYNALNALLGREMTHFDKKDRADMRTVGDIVSPNSPYVAQIHMGVDWEDKGKTMFSVEYYRFEEAAKRSGWTTERFDNGLLITRPS